MGSKAVKIMLEVLLAIAVASGLSYIPAIGGNVVIDFAIIPLILLSLRHGEQSQVFYLVFYMLSYIQVEQDILLFHSMIL